MAPHPDYPLDGASLLRVLEQPEQTFERERANLGQRDPARRAAMRARYGEWERQLPDFPEATFSVPATKADLARPS